MTPDRLSEIEWYIENNIATAEHYQELNDSLVEHGATSLLEMFKDKNIFSFQQYVDTRKLSTPNNNMSVNGEMLGWVKGCLSALRRHLREIQ